SSTNTIGGTTPGERNVVSGNGTTAPVRPGIQVFGNFSGNIITGNFVGTNAAGTAGIPNAGNGLHMANGVFGNTLGGIGAGAGNLIVFNTGIGVNVPTGAGTGNAIRVNLVFSNTGLG